MLRWIFVLTLLPFLSNFAIANSITVTGQVTDVVTKLPITGVKLTLKISEGYNQEVVFTDSLGNFVFQISSAIMPGYYNVKIEKEGYYSPTGFMLVRNGENNVFTLKPKPVVEEIYQSEDTVAVITADNNLVFLLDVSGSMNDPNKIDILKVAMKYLLTLYRPQDKVAIVTYSDNAKVYMPTSTIGNISFIQQSIDSLKCEGKTEGGRGLDLAYKVLLKSFIANGNNKVILVTDGLFTSTSNKTGSTMDKLILASLKKKMNLSVFAVGDISQKVIDHLERMSKMGEGHFAHLTSEDEAIKQMILEAGFKVKR
jgi:Mg-chelatase subunit ChlD